MFIKSPILKQRTLRDQVHEFPVVTEGDSFPAPIILTARGVMRWQFVRRSRSEVFDLVMGGGCKIANPFSLRIEFANRRTIFLGNQKCSLFGDANSFGVKSKTLLGMFSIKLCGAAHEILSARARQQFGRDQLRLDRLLSTGVHHDFHDLDAATIRICPVIGTPIGQHHIAISHPSPGDRRSVPTETILGGAIFLGIRLARQIGRGRRNRGSA